MLIPDDDKQRKMLPMFSQIARYFPKALRELTKVSVVNNVRYNPDRAPNDINWNRGKSPMQMDSAFHHMLEHVVDGKVFDTVPEDVAKVTGIEKIYILAQAWWRIGAELELTIEKQEMVEALAAVNGDTLDAVKKEAAEELDFTHYTKLAAANDNVATKVAALEPPSKTSKKPFRARVGNWVWLRGGAPKTKGPKGPCLVYCCHGRAAYTDWAWVDGRGVVHHPELCK